MLGIKEKRALQKIIDGGLASLNAGGLGIKEKRALQKEIEDAFAKLQVAIDTQPEQAIQNEKLQALIDGKYNSETPAVFLKILKEIIAEINTVDPVKEPVVKYCDAHVDQAQMIMESVLTSQ
jgi:hypothetical protein